MSTRDPDQPTRRAPIYPPTQPYPGQPGQPGPEATRPFPTAQPGPEATQPFPTGRPGYESNESGYEQPAGPITLSPPPRLTGPQSASAGSVGRLIVPLAIGAGVAVILGVYGKVHTPTGIAVSVAGFSGPLTVKVWLATAGVTLAGVQLLSAFGLYGRLPGVRGAWLGPLHRWSGRIAFFLTVPVVVHCLYALGFSDYSPRTLAHSLLGCVFFGAFTTKMLALTKKGLAGWVLPLFGGVVFTALVGVWATSALWFFTTSGIRF